MTTTLFRYQILVKSISLLFIILFVYAATSKLLVFEQFKLQLGNVPFISNDAHWLAWVIPFIEYVIVGLLLIPKYLLTAFYASLSLLIVFTLYLMLVLNFSDHIPCSCGGIIAALSWKAHLVFNSIFILFAFMAIKLLKKQKLIINT